MVYFRSMNEVEILVPDLSSELALPYADGGIHAGFLSPSQDKLERTFDLNRELVRNAAATFYARVVGDSMIDAHIYEGDILIIDKSLSARDGSLVVGYLDGEFTLKHLDLSQKKEGLIWLVPANPKYSRIRVTAETDFRIWGVVTYVIHNTMVP